MVSVNTIVIGGHLGADPEDKRTATGKQLCVLRIATNRWDHKAQAEVADWHTVLAWEKQAEHCLKYLSKGSAVLVEGRLVVNQWEGSDGKKQYKHEIVASRVNFLGRGRADESRSGAESEHPPAPPVVEGGSPAAEGRSRGYGARFADAIPF